MGRGGRAGGGTGGLRRSAGAGLVEVVVGDGVGLSGIEVGTLVEVVGEGFLGDLFSFPTAEIHGKLGLGRSPGWMEERG